MVPLVSPLRGENVLLTNPYCSLLVIAGAAALAACDSQSPDGAALDDPALPGGTRPPGDGGA
jgi:hypothetical protein